MITQSPTSARENCRLVSNESADILGLCAAALDELEVSWRFSRGNVISVARRTAVARLDEFVGPKY